MKAPRFRLKHGWGRERELGEALSLCGPRRSSDKPSDELGNEKTAILEATKPRLSQDNEKHEEPKTPPSLSG